MDRARRGRGGGLGRLPLRREAPARANGGTCGRASGSRQTRVARVKALDAPVSLWNRRSWEPWTTNGREWTTARRGTAAGRTERAAAERRFRPGRMLSILCCGSGTATDLTATRYALVDGHTDRDVHKDRNRVQNSMLAAWECGACTLAQSGAAVGCVRYAMGWRPSALRSALMSARHARLSM